MPTCVTFLELARGASQGPTEDSYEPEGAAKSVEGAQDEPVQELSGGNDAAANAPHGDVPDNEEAYETPQEEETRMEYEQSDRDDDVCQKVPEEEISIERTGQGIDTNDEGELNAQVR